MNTFEAEAAQIINAPAAALYGIVADYHVGHRAILPKPYFTDLKVEQGGYGAGTRLWAYMEVWGQKYTYHQEVTEPEPGRVLKETDLETGQYTTFTFEPLSDGQTKVTIHSVFPRKPGFAGFMESLMQPLFARNIYRKELNNLAVYGREKPGAA